MSNTETQAQQRSSFVSIIAWIFIVFTGFGSLICLMQNIMVHTMFSGPEMQTAMNSSDASSKIPPFANFMFSHFKLFVFVMFAMTFFALISSIGLLKRKNWARKTFIGIIGISIIFMLGGIVAQYFFFPDPADLGAKDIPNEMKTMMKFMQIFFVIFYTAIASILGWVIKKLVSPSVALEFR